MASSSWAVVTLVVLYSASISCVEVPTNSYTNKFDNFDVEKVLNNGRILTNYIRCLMDEGSCTPEGRELKKTIPDALAGGCTKCSDKQKQTTERVIKHLMNNRKPDWERLSKKYDPNGLYESKYKELIEKSKKEEETKTSEQNDDPDNNKDEEAKGSTKMSEQMAGTKEKLDKQGKEKKTAPTPAPIK